MYFCLSKLALLFQIEHELSYLIAALFVFLEFCLLLPELLGLIDRTFHLFGELIQGSFDGSFGGRHFGRVCHGPLLQR